MPKKFICDGKKYEIGGPKMDTICLPAFLKNLPSTIKIERYRLSLKTEFHVSLVCIGKIAEKNKINNPDFIKNTVDDFCEFTRHNKVDLLLYRNEFKFVTENEKRSVIVMCDISNLNKFFDFLNKKYGLKLEYPSTHLTLYTLQPDIGIFVTNSEDISKLTKPINIPILSSKF